MSNGGAFGVSLCAISLATIIGELMDLRMSSCRANCSVRLSIFFHYLVCVFLCVVLWATRVGVCLQRGGLLIRTLHPYK